VVAGCDDGGLCNVPPSAPTSGTTAAGTTAQNFALHTIHLGDEPGTCSDGTSWCQYGYNLDGQNTQVNGATIQSGSCTPVADANPLNEQDGPGGLDNSFGPNIVNTLLEAVVSNPSQTLDTSIAAGHFTVMMDITGLLATPGQNSTGITGMLLAGVNFAQSPNASTAVPTFTTADNWPVDPSYVTGSTAGQPLPSGFTSTVTFTGAYDANGTFVSGSPTNVTLTLSVSGQQIVVPVQHATITFTHPGVQDGGATADTHLSSGIIAGIVDAQKLVTSITAVAGNFNICGGSTLTTLQQSILKAADIMDDASYSPSTPCNGVSIGLGFEADQIGPPQVAGTPGGSTNPCTADGGTDGGGTGNDSGAADAGTD
jgi:hypothetical protein